MGDCETEIRATILGWLPRCGAFTEDARAISHRFRFDRAATERVLEQLADEGLIERRVKVSYGPARASVSTNEGGEE